MRLPITTHSLRNKEASSSELVNCYVEQLPADARAPYLIRRCPGAKRRYVNGEASPHWLLKRHPSVNAICSIYGDLNTTGEIAYRDLDGTSIYSPTGFTIRENMDLDANTTTLVAVSEPLAYTLSGAGAVAQISDADFTARGAGDVEFLDQYLLYREPGSGRFFGSDIGSATAYTSTSFATAEEHPDKLVGMKSDSGQVLLFGEETIEVWDAKGGSGFPFRSTINGAINKGCLNGRTVTLADGKLFWVSDDYTVCTLNGMSAVPVSNPAIDQQLRDDPAIRSPLTRAFGYAWDGHNYLVIRSANNCWVFDIATGAWHKRKSLGHDTWRFRDAEEALGRVWLADNIGDDSNGTKQFWISEIDPDGYKEGTVDTVMQWTYQPVWSRGRKSFHDRLEITLNVGSGDETVTDPLITLEYSEDKGCSWLPCAKREIGSYGEKYQRVVWHNLGSGYDRIYRASVSDNVPVTVTDTMLEGRGGGF